MRVIKFRAWDKRNKKMRKVDSVSFHCKESSANALDDQTPKVVNLWGKDIINEKWIIRRREANEVILMQFTGLHDKNGKEIYEHDVMKDNSGQMFPIKYLSGAFVFADTPLCDMSPCVDCEVIGNIYEHPELLKVND